MASAAAAAPAGREQPAAAATRTPPAMNNEIVRIRSPRRAQASACALLKKGAHRDARPVDDRILLRVTGAALAAAALPRTTGASAATAAAAATKTRLVAEPVELIGVN